MIIGIRRQTKSHWERRSPLTPADLLWLKGQVPSLRVIVQPSKSRIFKDEQYANAGVQLSDDLSPCTHILGIKEVPLDGLFPERSYFYFSHTIKGQKHNMPALRTILARKITLFDYEMIRNDKGQRLIAFGRFAGIAGAIDILAGLGRAIISRGISNQFLKVTLSYTYDDLNEAYSKIKKIGEQMVKKGIQKSLLPLVFSVTGSGRCAQGALEVLELLPHKKAKVEQLPHLEQRGDIVYICQVKQQDIMVDGEGEFSKEDYRKNPEKYKCQFLQKVVQYTTCLIHCIYWQPKYPVYISKLGLQELSAKGPLKLLAISDVTCDIAGSIQMLEKSYSPDDPFFGYDPQSMQIGSWTEGIQKKIIYQGCDFLPCELSFDASLYFSSILREFLLKVGKGERPQYLANSVIAEGGELAPNFKYLHQFL